MNPARAGRHLRSGAGLVWETLGRMRIYVLGSASIHLFTVGVTHHDPFGAVLGVVCCVCAFAGVSIEQRDQRRVQEFIKAVQDAPRRAGDGAALAVPPIVVAVPGVRLPPRPGGD